MYRAQDALLIAMVAKIEMNFRPSSAGRDSLVLQIMVCLNASSASANFGIIMDVCVIAMNTQRNG